MNKEYAIYPFRYMNITQRHDQGNHIAHWNSSANYSDFPWDEALEDGGRSYFEPQNDFIVEEILGLGNNTTNTVRLKSINKIFVPFKDEPDYLCLTLSHMNEDNLQQLYVGQILGKGSKILLEGTDGFATGNHFHVTANLGKYYGFLQNSNGTWCFTYHKSLQPEQAFYIDNLYTNVINSAGYSFNLLPSNVNVIGTPVNRDEHVDQIELITKDVYCRKTPALKGEILGYVKPGIYNYSEVFQLDNYTWYFIGLGWIAYNKEWAILYPKKEEQSQKDNNIKPNLFQKIINFIIAVIKRIFKVKKQ